MSAPPPHPAASATRRGPAGPDGPHEAEPDDRIDQIDQIDRGGTGGRGGTGEQGAAQGVPWLSDTEQAAWRGLIEMWRLLMAQLERDLQRDGLSHSDYQVLVALSEAPQRMLRMSDLAEQTILSRSRLSHQVRRMEEAGLVDRASCPTDRRGSFAVLTDLGWATIRAAAPDHVRAVREHLFDHLTPEQVDHLLAITAPVAARLRRTALVSD